MGRRVSGEGSISFHRPSGRYQAKIWVETPTGRKRKSVYGRSRKEVAAKLRDILAEQQREGIVCDDENITVGEYLDLWLKNAVAGSVRQSTYDRYAGIVERHLKPGIGRTRLAKLTPLQAQNLYRNKLEEGHAPASVNKLHAVLHKALSQAVRWQLLTRNVCDAVTPPRPTPKQEMKTLTPEQARKLLQAARGDRLEALYVLAVSTGMREGELLGLRWEDVDLEAGTLQVRRTLVRNGGKVALGDTKTKASRRAMHLTPHAAASLKAHRVRQAEEKLKAGALYHDNGLVFANEVGNLINPSNLRKRSFVPLLERAGVPPVRFHDLRHTAATLLLSQGVHAKLTSELLGHANIAITLNTYSHVLPNMGKGTAEAMRRALEG